LPLPSPLDVNLPSAALGWVLSLLWIAAVTNFFNFMDGIDGLAGGQAAVSLAAVILAGWSAEASTLAACVGVASLAFLFHNWSPARVFMGDVGSGFLGFLVASLPFLAPVDRRAPAVVAVAIGLALFLLDPLETLFRRAIARKHLTGAHREHVYQQYLDPGEAAGTVAGALVAVGCGLAALGALAYRHPSLGWVALLTALLAYLGERRMAGRQSRLRPRHMAAPEGGNRR
jgi:UDP-N-acetylmuramyl pentapeptide phosphotransferase/UDP-N-acetylglucosamine-1-phosphate transferase